MDFGKIGSKPIGPQPEIPEQPRPEADRAQNQTPEPQVPERTPRASEREVTAKIGEQTLYGQARKGELANLLDQQTSQTKNSPQTTQPAAFAGELLRPRQTPSGQTQYDYVGPQAHLNHQQAAQLGSELAELRRTDPSGAQQTIPGVLDRLDPSDRQQVATEFIRNTTHQELVHMERAGDTDLLQRMNREISSGEIGPQQREQLNRMESAHLMSRTQFNILFVHFDRGTDARIREIIARHETNPDAVRNVINVVTTSGFHALSTSEQGIMLNALNERAGSRELAQMYQSFGLSPEFRGLNEGNRREILEFYTRMERNGMLDGMPEQNFHALPANASMLVSTPGFELLTDSDRSQMLDSLAHTSDPLAGRMLAELVSDEGFHGLNQGIRNNIITQLNSEQALRDMQPLDFEARRRVTNDLVRFAQTPSVQGMNDFDRFSAIDIMYNVSLHSALNPDNAVARNTAEQLAAGRMPMRISHQPWNTAEGFVARNGAIHFNVGSRDWTGDRLSIASIAAHEVSHVRNGDTPAGTRERFLDEYRAYYVDRLAETGRPPTADDIRWALRTLVLGSSNGSYEHLHDLYQNDPHLRRVVRTIQDRLDQNPPVITDPEDMRQMLLNAPGGQNSEYLRREGNLDNH